MTDRQLAVVSAADGYAGILKAFRARQAELGLSADKIDEIVGGEENSHRYATKWLSGLKSLGPQSWGDALGALGMKLVFVEDDAAMRRIAKHRETRAENHVRTIARIRVTKWLFTPRSARKAARTRASKLSARKRSASARKAAKARWKQVRAKRRQGRNAPQMQEVAVPQALVAKAKVRCAIG